MGMTKLSATTFIFAVCVFIAAAIVLPFLSPATAYAEDTAVYIFISPTDDSLLANEYAQSTKIAAKDVTEGVTQFYLLESYYYKAAKRVYGYDLTDYDGGKQFAVFDEIDASCIIPASELPAAALAQGTPNITLTLREGASVSVRMGSMSTVVITSENSDYTLRFIGYGDDNKVMFSAQKGDGIGYASAVVSNFNDFTVPYHSVTAERKASLQQGDGSTSGGANGDLTAGTPSKTLRIILIIGIAVPALLIIILIFKPTSDTKRNYDKRAVKSSRRDNIDYDRDRDYYADRDRYDRGYRDYERRDYERDRRDYDRGYDDRGGYPRDHDRDRYDR